MQPARRRNGGDSWPELLAVLSILLLVFSLVAPVVVERINLQRSRQAFGEIRLLIAASSRYNNEYRMWPTGEPAARRDVRLGERVSSANMLNILAARDAAGNEGQRSNTAHIDFLALAARPGVALRTNQRGDVMDPWSEPYQIVLDANYDNILSIDDSRYGPIVGSGVAVWSKGPDRRSDTDDDLLSWKQ